MPIAPKRDTTKSICSRMLVPILPKSGISTLVVIKNPTAPPAFSIFMKD